MKQCEVLVIGGGRRACRPRSRRQRRGAGDGGGDEREGGRAAGEADPQVFRLQGAPGGIRGIDIVKQLIEECGELGVEMMLNSTVAGIYQGKTVAVDVQKSLTEHELVRIQAQRIVISTGAAENAIRFPGWTLPGVMGAGAIQTMCNYHRVMPGKKLLMIGSGSVGLIVCYQLMQAGAEIVGIVEALPQINGYAVHASKLAREGVPIYTGYTITQALGDDPCNRRCDCKGKPGLVHGAGSEITLDTDMIACGVGLKPLIGMAHMAGCELVFDKALGGWAPCPQPAHGVYSAGDLRGG